jgi:hypothetical protein
VEVNRLQPVLPSPFRLREATTLKLVVPRQPLVALILVLMEAHPPFQPEVVILQALPSLVDLAPFATQAPVALQLVTPSTLPFPCPYRWAFTAEPAFQARSAVAFAGVPRSRLEPFVQHGVSVTLVKHCSTHSARSRPKATQFQILVTEFN